MIILKFLNKFRLNEILYISIFFLTVLKIFTKQLFFQKITSLEWTTVSHIPLVQFLINQTFLKNDIYFLGIIDSPNIFFSAIIAFFTISGFDIFTVLLAFKLIYIYFGPLLVLIFCLTILEKFNETIEFPLNLFFFIKIFLFFGVLIISNLYYLDRLLTILLSNYGIEFSSGSFLSPFGWEDPLNHRSIAPNTLAFLVGIIFNIFWLKSKYSLSYLSLFLTTMIHPIIGIANFLIGQIYEIFFYSLKRIKKTLLLFFIGVFLPITFSLIYFGALNELSSKDFIEIYVNSRHPHHYLLSNLVGWGSLFWICILFFNLIISFFSRLKSLKLLNFLCLLFVILSIIFQYLGTEIFYNLSISLLGPSRFTQYIFMISLLNFVLTVSILIKDKFSNEASEKVEKHSKKVISKGKFTIICFCIFLFSLNLFIPNNLDKYKKFDDATVQWIKKNTDENSLFFISGEDNAEYGSIFSFNLRIFGKRSVWVDDAFPFNYSYVNEWSRRYEIYKNFYLNKNLYNFICEGLDKDVDYIITSTSNKFKLSNEPIFENLYWTIFTLESLNENCKI